LGGLLAPGLWYLVGQFDPAVTKTQLAGNGKLTLLLELDERAVPTADPKTCWTGTTAQGTYTGEACAGWTSARATDRGTLGYSIYGDADWTNWFSTACNEMHRLYCFEQ
jgi:hypothetical protein